MLYSCSVQVLWDLNAPDVELYKFGVVLARLDAVMYDVVHGAGVDVGGKLRPWSADDGRWRGKGQGQGGRGDGLRGMPDGVAVGGFEGTGEGAERRGEADQAGNVSGLAGDQVWVSSTEGAGSAGVEGTGSGDVLQQQRRLHAQGSGGGGEERDAGGVGEGTEDGELESGVGGLEQQGVAYDWMDGDAAGMRIGEYQYRQVKGADGAEREAGAGRADGGAVAGSAGEESGGEGGSGGGRRVMAAGAGAQGRGRRRRDGGARAAVRRQARASEREGHPFTDPEEVGCGFVSQV